MGPRRRRVLAVVVGAHCESGGLAGTFTSLCQARVVPAREGVHLLRCGRRYGLPVSTRTSTTAAGTRSVHRLKVTLGTSPPVWRRLAVPSGTTLEQLHHVLQVAMGWEDCHLHQFVVGSARYGPRDGFLDDGWGTPPKNEATAKLSRVASAGTSFGYEYDFGDGWQHQIVVEKVDEVVAGGTGTDGPVCLSGRRACPPEDCGGVWGYEHLLEVLAHPEHEEHEDMLEWVGGDHDPERFDVDEINARVHRLAWARASVSRR